MNNTYTCPITGNACERTSCIGGHYCALEASSAKHNQQPAGGFQTCPLCHGEGVTPAVATIPGPIFKTCPVCAGERIISITTGLPPEKT